MGVFRLWVYLCEKEFDGMGWLELIFIAVGLSMDAFAVSVSKGLCVREHQWRNSIATGIYFGVFQAVMPLIGFFLGSQFKEAIMQWDHWIAFGLLVVIGLNMIRESRQKDEDAPEPTYGFKKMLLLSLATSIDALAVGVTFAFFQINILLAVLAIGVITFVISTAGVKIGCVFGDKLKSKAEIAGGIILILIGTKILLEHLGVIHF
jgi:putative Mn2+ efflux pump MntP